MTSKTTKWDWGTYTPSFSSDGCTLVGESEPFKVNYNGQLPSNFEVEMSFLHSGNGIYDLLVVTGTNNEPFQTSFFNYNQNLIVYNTWPPNYNVSISNINMNNWITLKFRVENGTLSIIHNNTTLISCSCDTSEYNYVGLEIYESSTNRQRTVKDFKIRTL